MHRRLARRTERTNRTCGPTDRLPRQPRACRARAARSRQAPQHAPGRAPRWRTRARPASRGHGRSPRTRASVRSMNAGPAAVAAARSSTDGTRSSPNSIRARGHRLVAIRAFRALVDARDVAADEILGVERLVELRGRTRNCRATRDHRESRTAARGPGGAAGREATTRKTPGTSAANIARGAGQSSIASATPTIASTARRRAGQRRPIATSAAAKSTVNPRNTTTLKRWGIRASPTIGRYRPIAHGVGKNVRAPATFRNGPTAIDAKPTVSCEPHARRV